MLLEIKNLSSGYNKIQIIFDVSLGINRQEIVSIVGHNGAGKSTTLKTIFGIIKAFAGNIYFMEEEITSQPPAARIKRGFGFVPQERFIFDKLTVRENLEISTYSMDDKSGLNSRYTSLYHLFPVLSKRLNQTAGTLSGGERRMLSLGGVLLRQPKLAMLDEPSLGLSPVMVKQMMDAIKELNRNLEMTILLVEQNVKQAFKISSRVYVLKTGRIILEESGENLLKRGEWWDLF